MQESITIRARRSQLGRAKGVGASGTGVGHWYAARITSLALLPLTLWFVFSLVRLAGARQEEVAHWIGQPWNAVLLLALIVATFHHAASGIQVVLEDYVSNKPFMVGGILAVKAAAWLLGLLASLSVLKLAL